MLVPRGQRKDKFAERAAAGEPARRKMLLPVSASVGLWKWLLPDFGAPGANRPAPDPALRGPAERRRLASSTRPPKLRVRPAEDFPHYEPLRKQGIRAYSGLFL